jgi:hypothetical protein
LRFERFYVIMIELWGRFSVAWRTGESSKAFLQVFMHCRRCSVKL